MTTPTGRRSDRTKVIAGPFWTRRKARQRERQYTTFLTVGRSVERWPDELPTWAKGVRVEKVGTFSWAVIATEHVGH